MLTAGPRNTGLAENVMILRENGRRRKDLSLKFRHIDPIGQSEEIDHAARSNENDISLNPQNGPRGCGIRSDDRLHVRRVTSVRFNHV